MNPLETLRTGLEAIRAHRMRSALMVLGILIGIAAVIMTVGLGEGAQAKVSSEISSLGTNLLTVSPGSTTSSAGIRGGFGSASTLTIQDADALSSKTVAPDVAAVAPTSQGEEVLTAGTSNWTTSVIGTEADWLNVRARSVVDGRFLDDQDVADHSDVVVLAPTTAEELGLSDPVGETVNIGGIPFTIIGELNSVGSGSSSSSTSNEDDEAIVPFTTFADQIEGGTSRDSVQSILIEATTPATLTAAYQETDDELLMLHHITTPADADFTISTQQQLLSTATSVDKTLTVLLAGIAAISLLVGGIGVMNIMLVSVTERVREIGLRKALGATPKLIRRQFLVESSILGLSGGLLGAVLGIVGTQVLPSLVNQPMSLSVAATVGAIVIAMAIGLGFGVYPATRAARLAPIDALRNE